MEVYVFQPPLNPECIWNVRGFGIYANVTIASSACGNYCYNTNTSISGGIGLVAANGTTWVSLN